MQAAKNQNPPHQPHKLPIFFLKNGSDPPHPSFPRFHSIISMISITFRQMHILIENKCYNLAFFKFHQISPCHKSKANILLVCTLQIRIHLFNDNNIRHFEMWARHHFDSIIREDFIQLWVEFFVTAIALYVIIRFAQHCNRDYKSQRCPVGIKVADSYWRNKLGTCHD